MAAAAASTMAAAAGSTTPEPVERMGVTASPPFRSGPYVVRPEWIDYNGHLNLAYYILLFDEATDALWRTLGLGDAFRAAGFGTFAVETHTLYRAELIEGETVTVDSIVLGADEKRLHLAYEMRRTRDGAVSALQELMYLCVSLQTRRAAAWPAPMAANLAGRAGRTPDWVGRKLAMPSQAPSSPSGARMTARA